jgi:hypothetical protein
MPFSFWCFEPVREAGRTLVLAQRIVAFRLPGGFGLRAAGEHAKECLVSFSASSPAAKGT